MEPVCFVIMPFGVKPDPSGGVIDFDRVYAASIDPGIRSAGMVPVRADMELTGGIIHKEMFERLVLADFAIADLTTANANVFYEVGVRHAARPRTTLPIVASHHRIPFDLTFVRALPYDLGTDNVFDEECQRALRDGVTTRFRELRDLASASDSAADSPLFQLVNGWQAAPLAHLATDVFRDRAVYREEIRERLRSIRELARSGVEQIEAAAKLDELRAGLDLAVEEVGVLIDLLLTERALERWGHMVDLVASFPAEVRRQVMVREQLGMALGRLGEDNSRSEGDRLQARRRAKQVLEEVLDEHGPSAETLGLLGRIHKAAWLESRGSDTLTAGAHLRDAIDTYVRGFRADTRDPFPGVNAVTLLTIADEPDDRALVARLAPVVRFAAEEQVAGDRGDYWAWATLAELSAVAGDLGSARRELGKALTQPYEGWMLLTTAQNLRVLTERPSSPPELAELSRHLESLAG